MLNKRLAASLRMPRGVALRPGPSVVRPAQPVVNNSKATLANCMAGLEQKATAYDGTDKDTAHSYLSVYEPLFASLRDNGTVHNILEIGIMSGAFLEALTRYFPPPTHVFGIDISLKYVKFAQLNPRVTIRQMDATDITAPSRLLANVPVKKFEVIIDDASHFPDHQIKTFGIFAPLLAPDGVYIIEDVNGAHLDTVLCGMAPDLKRYNMTAKVEDLRAAKNRFDDILIIVRHKLNV